jgi:hypothetical protein
MVGFSKEGGLVCRDGIDKVDQLPLAALCDKVTVGIKTVEM